MTARATKRTIHNWQQSGNKTNSGTKELVGGVQANLGRARKNGTKGQMTMLMEGYSVAPNQSRVCREIVGHPRHCRTALAGATMMLSLPGAISLCGHLHPAIMAAQPDSQP